MLTPPLIVTPLQHNLPLISCDKSSIVQLPEMLSQSNKAECVERESQAISLQLHMVFRELFKVRHKGLLSTNT
jgi:hypothetical protein